MIKTIKNLTFVSIRYFYKEFEIEQHENATYLVELWTEEMFKLPKGNYKYIGRSNELTREVVESELNMIFEEYINRSEEHNV